MSYKLLKFFCEKMDRKIYCPRKNVPIRLSENLNRGISVQLVENSEKSAAM